MMIVEVPTTSANCSIGFDSLGLALNWKARFTFEPSDVLEVSGCDEEFANADNLVVQAFRHVAETYNLDMPAFHLHIESEVPLARGLGSSSCCVAAGISAANAWYDLHLDEERLLELATDLEGHPDNAAPALFGGMTACFMNSVSPDLDASMEKMKQSAQSQGFGSESSQEYRTAYNQELDAAVLISPASQRRAEIELIKFDCAPFHCLAVIPPYQVSTPKARKVLPKVIPFKEAVAQTGHALIFEYAIQKGDEDLLRKSCKDVLHEPYRKALIPDYEDVKAMADEMGLPFWISGSGPTMLALSLDEHKLMDMEDRLHKELPDLMTKRLKISKEGTVVRYE